MKTLRLAAILFVLSAFAETGTCGQQAKPAGASDTNAAPSVTLKVKYEQDRSRSTSNTVTSVKCASYTDSYGLQQDSRSEIRRTKKSKSLVKLAIEVRNAGSSPATVELQWYFVADSVDGGNQWVFDKGSKTLDLPSCGVIAKTTVESRTLTLDSLSVDGAKKTETGSKANGYIVLVKAADRILRVAASSKSLEEAGRSPQELQKLMIFPDAHKPESARGKKKP